MKKKTVMILSLCLAAAVIVGGVFFFYYDGLSSAAGNADNTLAAVKNNITRRAQLTEKLADFAKAHGEVEKQTLDAAADACGAAKSAKTVSELEAAESALGKAESALKLALRASAPGLVNTDTAYAALTEDIYEAKKATGTLRKNHNAAVRAYNEKISSFPWSFFSRLYGFGEKTLFAAEEDTLETPAVDF